MNLQLLKLAPHEQVLLDKFSLTILFARVDKPVSSVTTVILYNGLSSGIIKVRIHEVHNRILIMKPVSQSAINMPLAKEKGFLPLGLESVCSCITNTRGGKSEIVARLCKQLGIHCHVCLVASSTRTRFATCQFFLDKCPCSKTSTDVSEQGHLSRKKCAKFHLIYEQIKCVKENLSSKSCSCGAGFKLQLKAIKPQGTARVFRKPGT